MLGIEPGTSCVSSMHSYHSSYTLSPLHILLLKYLNQPSPVLAIKKIIKSICPGCSWWRESSGQRGTGSPSRSDATSISWAPRRPRHPGQLLGQRWLKLSGICVPSLSGPVTRTCPCQGLRRPGSGSQAESSTRKPDPSGLAALPPPWMVQANGQG